MILWKKIIIKKPSFYRIKIFESKKTSKNPYTIKFWMHNFTEVCEKNFLVILVKIMFVLEWCETHFMSFCKFMQSNGGAF